MGEGLIKVKNNGNIVQAIFGTEILIPPGGGSMIIPARFRNQLESQSWAEITDFPFPHEKDKPVEPAKTPKTKPAPKPKEQAADEPKVKPDRTSKELLSLLVETGAIKVKPGGWYAVPKTKLEFHGAANMPLNNKKFKKIVDKTLKKAGG